MPCETVGNQYKCETIQIGESLYNWAIGKPRPLVTVAPSDKQTELLMLLQWELSVWKPCYKMFLHNFGHRRAK